MVRYAASRGSGTHPLPDRNIRLTTLQVAAQAFPCGHPSDAAFFPPSLETNMPHRVNHAPCLLAGANKKSCPPHTSDSVRTVIAVSATVFGVPLGLIVHADAFADMTCPVVR